MYVHLVERDYAGNHQHLCLIAQYGGALGANTKGQKEVLWDCPGERRNGGEVGMNNDILSVLCGQNSTVVNVFDPEILAFRNKVIELQKNCPMVEWEHDMGATVPYCKLDKAFCNGQCSFKTDDCPCETDRR